MMVPFLADEVMRPLVVVVFCLREFLLKELWFILLSKIFGVLITIAVTFSILEDYVHINKISILILCKVYIEYANC